MIEVTKACMGRDLGGQVSLKNHRRSKANIIDEPTWVLTRLQDHASNPSHGYIKSICVPEWTTLHILTGYILCTSTFLITAILSITVASKRHFLFMVL